MILYRPVGLKELQLIIDAGFQAFPPRLSHQPIFYPVLNFDYAAQIARDWNTQDEVSDYVGFVTEFTVDDEYVSQFEVKVVGGSQHEELWVPAEELAQFNKNIQGEIAVVAHYVGDQFIGQIDPTTHLPK